MNLHAAAARAGRLVAFVGYAFREMITATGEVAWDAISPGSGLQPGVVELPLRCRTPLEITTLANLITLTPGTLTLAITHDPPALYVHGMYAPDADEFRARLQAMEVRVLHALRPEGFAPPGAPARDGREVTP